MKITIISPGLPPRLDGIGDYSAFLGEELARQGHDVSILTATENAALLQNVRVQKAFTLDDPQSVNGIISPLVADPPDWVLLQYNPFSYGKWGWNPQTVSALKQIRTQLPQTRIAVMAHETFVPAESPQFVVMTVWQRALFFQLGQTCDLLFLSVEVWAARFQKWFPRIPVRHLPVGANLHRSSLSKTEARQKAEGLDESAFVVGLFGTAHPSRMFGAVADVLRVLSKNNPKTVLLYVGPHGEAVRTAVGDAAPIHDAGALPPGDVADRFCAMDICLTPYLDGISTRRGAFMAGLQHGIPSVGTSGIHTDSVLARAEGTAFFAPPVTDLAAFEACALRLQNDADLRETMGRAGQALYETEFDWQPIVQNLTGEMKAANAQTQK